MNGGKITTFTLKHMDPFAVRAGDIDVRDIAHALALKCRFNGHCRAFYSVAEHSVRVSKVLGGQLAMAGLMHDAAEAYLADLGGPIKGRFHVLTEEGMRSFEEAEDKLLVVIAEQLGIPKIDYAAVRGADRVLLATEARDLFGVDPRAWGIEEEPLAEVIKPWGWEEAEKAFVNAFWWLKVQPSLG